MSIIHFLAKIADGAGGSHLQQAVALDLLTQFNNEEDLIGHMDDVSRGGGQNGIITSLIYHDETEAFFKEHADDILQLAEELEFDRPISEFGSATNLFDTMAWFGYEETTYLLREYLLIVGRV